MEMHLNDKPTPHKPTGAVHGGADWERLLSRHFLPGRVTLAAGGHGGRVGPQTSAGRLWMTQLAVWPQTIAHTAPHLDALSAADRSSVIAHVIIEGEGFVEQGGSALSFQAGDISFRNLQRRFPNAGRVCRGQAAVHRVALASGAQVGSDARRPQNRSGS